MKAIFPLLCVALVFSCVVQRVLKSAIKSLTRDFVNQINRSIFTEQVNQNFGGFNSSFSIQSWARKRLMLRNTTKRNGDQTDFTDLQICTHPVNSGPLPPEFDARTKWSHCNDIISHVRDQSGCENSWAMASAATISDRICIASKGRQKVQISALDIMTCSNPESYYNCSESGNPTDAFRFWASPGIVSGGDYGDYNTCRPYPVCPSKGPIPCTDDLTEASKVRKFPSPLYPNLYECEKGCLNSESYSKDRYRAKEVCQVEPMNEEAIQREIWTYGSVTAKFDIFKSFLSFGKGVYYQDSTEKFGVQAIKLIGWGTHYVGNLKIKYWHAVNSWGAHWGNQGFFKIIRGINHCAVEENVLSGLADIILTE